MTAMNPNPDEVQPRSRKPKVVAGVLLSCAVLAVAYLAWISWGDDAVAWTNDAKLDADYTVIAPRVSGNLVAVHVEDHDYVQRGDTLVDVDPRDYQAAVDAAEAQVASAQASLAEIEAEIARQPALVRNAQAVVAGDVANANYARLDAERYRQLRRNGNGSEQSAQQAASKAEALNAQRDADQANLDSVRQQTEVLKAQRESIEAQLAQAKAQREQARLALSYAQLKAPVDGVVAEQSARVGAWVDAGTALMAIVPVQAIYVTAYYREVDITQVRVGQPVTVSVDAYPELTLEGHVRSLSPATGMTFSPVSSNDAAGNFTKIVQRLPIKIALDPGQPGLDRLKVGLSVETEIHTAAD